MDIISKLGGYKGAFEPILMYFYPIIILHFLIHYSHTIRDIYKDNYKSELEKTLRASYDRIKLVPNIEKKLELNDK
jgi:hypothetical protein